MKKKIKKKLDNVTAAHHCAHDCDEKINLKSWLFHAWIANEPVDGSLTGVQLAWCYVDLHEWGVGFATIKVRIGAITGWRAGGMKLDFWMQMMQIFLEKCGCCCIFCSQCGDTRWRYVVAPVLYHKESHDWRMKRLWLRNCTFMYKQDMVLLVPWSTKLWMNQINLRVKKRGQEQRLTLGRTFSIWEGSWPRSLWTGLNIFRLWT